MKALGYSLILIGGLIVPVQAAITFSGGTGGAPVVMTLTSDLQLPVTLGGVGTSFGLVLEDAYLTAPGSAWQLPSTAYGSPGSIAAEFLQAGGTTVSFTAYGQFGPLNGDYARIDPNDLVILFTLPAFNAVPGDTFIIRTGSVTLDPSVPLPTGNFSSYIGISGGGVDMTNVVPVPEATTALLGTLGGIALAVRRKR